MWLKNTVTTDLKKLLSGAVLSCFLILLSSPGSAADWIYNIKPGDNLWNISERYLVDMRYWRRLQSLNNITSPNRLPPSSKLRIPLEWTKIHPTQARVKSLSGQVVFLEKGRTSSSLIKTGMLLEAGTEIRSAANASVTLRFADDSQLTLWGNSTLKLDTMEYYGNEEIFNTRLQLLKGKADNEVNPNRHDNTRFEIRTPSSAAAVRGTKFRVSVPDNTQTNSEVLKGEVGVSNTLGQVFVAAGFGTVTKVDEKPQTPVELLPAPLLNHLPTMFEHLPLTIDLPDQESVTRWRIQIDNDPQFETPEVDQNSSSNRIKIADLADGDYSLRLRGIDAHGLEGHDARHTFTLNTHPAPPLIVTPSAKASVAGNAVHFQWTQTNANDQYHFQLSKSDTFEDPYINLPTQNKNELTLTEPLASGSWFWRLATHNEAEGKGPLSEPSSFRVLPPGITPDPAQLSETEISFRWSAREANDRYQIQIANDPGFNHLLVDTVLDQPQTSIPRPTVAGTLYMRTKILDADNFAGPWSSTQSVVIPEEPNYWPLLVLPLLLLLL